MVRGKNTRGMVVLLLLFAAMPANAAPTISGRDRSLVLSASSAGRDVYSYNKIETGLVTGPVDLHLVTVAAELNKPPLDVSESPIAASEVRSLPRIPGTLLMALVGFLCVSLVRDRKTWLTVLIGLLAIGQAGFSALPHLAQILSNGKKVEYQSSDFAGLYRPQQSHIRGDIGDTYYIGLLRHLAGIPQAGQFCRFTNSHPSVQAPCHNKSFAFVRTGFPKERYNCRTAFLSAIISPLFFIGCLINGLGIRTERFDDIVSRLVFISVIRGPPHLA